MAQKCELPLVCLCCVLGLLLEGCFPSDVERYTEACINQIHSKDFGGDLLDVIESCKEADAKNCFHNTTGEDCEKRVRTCHCDQVSRIFAITVPSPLERLKTCCSKSYLLEEASVRALPAGGEDDCERLVSDRNIREKQLDRRCRQGLDFSADFALEDAMTHSALSSHGAGYRLMAPGLQVGGFCLFVVAAALTLRRRQSSASGNSPALLDEETSSE